MTRLRVLQWVRAARGARGGVEGVSQGHVLLAAGDWQAIVALGRTANVVVLRGVPPGREDCGVIVVHALVVRRVVHARLCVACLAVTHPVFARVLIIDLSSTKGKQVMVLEHLRVR